MKFKCLNCEKEFLVLKKAYEPHGEKIYICPNCMEEDLIIEVTTCVICKENYAETQLRVCGGCLSDIESLIKFGENSGLNYFLNSIYEDDEINSILKSDLYSKLKGKNLPARELLLKKIEQFTQVNAGEIADYLIMQCKK